MLTEGSTRGNVKKPTSNKRPIGPPPSRGKYKMSTKRYNKYLEEEYLKYVEDDEFHAYSEGWLDGSYPDADHWNEEMWSEMLGSWNDSVTKNEREKADD